MKLNLKSETAAAIVSGASFIASAGHIVKVVDETNPLFLSLVYPIGIDGLIYVGIRALQAGRVFAGMAAIAMGGFYSLAFNAHAEQAFHMSRLLVAASMPACMMVAMAIEATGRKAKKIEVPVPAPIATPAPVAVPAIAVQTRSITWVGAGARYTLPIVSAKAPAPVRVKATVPAAPAAPRAKAITATASTRGRVATWDVEKAVRLITDGRTNAEVAETVGTNEKAVQRTRRSVRMVQQDASTPDELIAETVGLSVAHVARVRAAM
jgi:hypothetical protein